MRLAGLDKVSHALLDSNVVIPNNRVALLVLPDQVANIPRRDGQDGVAGANTGGNGHGRAQQDIPVPGDDAAGHGGDKHVDASGQQALARLFRRCERGHGRGEGGFEVERVGQTAVEGVFG